MALIVLAGGEQRSGSAGGITYSRNRFGAYMRNRAVPVNPNTDRQVVVRNFVRSLSIAWENTLSQADRDKWETYATNIVWQNKLGQSVLLTGLNHYIRSNVPRLQAGMSQVNSAPSIFNLGTAELALGCTASEATQQASAAFDNSAGWATEDGAAELFYAGIPRNAAIKFFGGPWRLLGSALGDSIGAPATPAVFDWAWPFGDGQRLWLRTRITRADGRLSEFARVNFLAAA